MKEDGKRMWEKGDRPQLSPTFPCITNDSKRYINRKTDNVFRLCI